MGINYFGSVLIILLSFFLKNPEVDTSVLRLSDKINLIKKIELKDQRIGQITKIQSLPDNQFVVYDRIVNMVYIINNEGFVIKIVSRSGRGPGELLRIGDIAVSENHLYVFDISNRKLVVFNHNGDFITEILHNTVAFHVAGNDSLVYLFDTININLQKDLISAIRISDKSVSNIPSYPSELLMRMAVGTAGLFKNISLSNNLICYVHPYEGVPVCYDTFDKVKTEYKSDVSIFKSPDAASFANQDPMAITHISAGLYTYRGYHFHVIRDIHKETDYIVVTNIQSKEKSTIFVDDVGILGIDSNTGAIYTIQQSDNPDEDLTVINVYSLEMFL